MKKGIVVGERDRETEKFRAIFDLPGFSKKQIQRSYTWFDYHVYKGRKPMYKILAHVIIAKINSKPRLRLLYRQLTKLPFLKALKYVTKEY